MFGYIKPRVPELKVKENEFYRATYCGLCRALGNRSKMLSFTLSYDFVFLSIVRMAVEKEKNIRLASKRCIAHPFKKRAYLKSNAQLEATSRAAALLLYYNLLDDINDSKGIKKLISGLMLPKASRIRKRNMGDGELDRIISRELELMAEQEKKETGSIYDLAEPFGRLLGSVFCDGVQDEKRKRGLYAFGKCIGRWIYILDAADDIEDDKKSGSFNRLIPEAEALGRGKFAEVMRQALIFELAEAEKILDLLDIEDEGLLNIIRNILYLGMPDTADRVLKGEKPKKKNTKGNSIDERPI